MPTPADIVRYLSEQEQKKAEKQRREDEKRYEQERQKQEELWIKQREEEALNERKQYVQSAINPILAEVGYDFKNAEFVLEQYKKYLMSKFESCISMYYDKRTALRELMKVIDSEFEKWLDGPWYILKDETDVAYKMESIKYLEDKHYVAFEVYNQAFMKVLSTIYTEKTNGKQALLKILDNISFNECLQVLKNFKNNLYELNKLSQEKYRFVNNELKEAITDYMLFYDYANILVAKKTNDLSWNKEKNTYIDEEKYNKALLYFYENKSLEEIKENIKRETYIKNKNMGNRGEEVVEYALSWLSDKYIRIPQVSVGRYEQKCILLQNTNYRNEKQEFDHIIVGPQGVFLVETKNYAGEITIDDDGNWIRKKEGQGIVGERNPIEQIRRHEKLMKSIVENVNIISIMCLSHPKVVVYGANNSSVKILKSDLLCEYIENYKAESDLNMDEIQLIVETIKKHIV